MKRSNNTLAYVALFVLAGWALWYWYTPHTANAPSPAEAALRGAISVDATSTPAGKTLAFPVPSDFGLATAPEQILVTSYIPPCDSGFEYCLYYNSAAWAGTNFESAGLAITRRLDLANKEACLTSQPAGYTNLTAATAERASYAMSVFSGLGDAGAGHYASGSEYRLFASDKCYQFDTRIGEMQFGNYPEGSIAKFTDADRSAMQETLLNIIRSMTLNQSGVHLQLP